MSDPLTIARVTITRILADNGDIVDHVIAESDDGYELGLAEALGMIELAKFTLVEARTSASETDI